MQRGRLYAAGIRRLRDYADRFDLGDADVGLSSGDAWVVDRAALLRNHRQQTAGGDHLLHELGLRDEGVLGALRVIADDALGEINFEVITVPCLISETRALNRQKSVVERIAEKGARKVGSDNARDAGSPQGPDCVLARRAATEIFAADQNVTGLDAGNEGRVNIFHGMLGQLDVVVSVQVARRNNLVGIDMGARVDVRAASDYTPHK